jgi:uncharacterized tellurite resistance protein B-like protein
VADAPNREVYFEDYVRNKVYYGLQRRLERGEADLDLGEDELRKLSLAGGLMAQVAWVHPNVSDAEVALMVDALQQHWHLAPEEAEFVAQVAISETATLLDRYRLARRFAEVCDHQDRSEFLNVLFAVAAADGHASPEEVEEIRGIARSLKLSHQEFIDAKLQVLYGPASTTS